jgi:hypothetical protein
MNTGNEAEYRAGALTIGPETDSQEELERAKRGLPPVAGSTYADFYTDPNISTEGYSASPSKENERPAYERSVYRPREIAFNAILELWAAHEGGSLASVFSLRPGDDGKPSADVAREAWEWVAETSGWSPVVHEVMRHLVLRNLTWAQWPRVHPVRGEWRSFQEGEKGTEERFFSEWCPWPFITYEKAGAAWLPFYRALRRHYRKDPFTINEQFFETR